MKSKSHCKCELSSSLSGKGLLSIHAESRQNRFGERLPLGWPFECELLAGTPSRTVISSTVSVSAKILSDAVAHLSVLLSPCFISINQDMRSSTPDRPLGG